MKELSLSDAFCEVLAGLAVLGACVPLLELSGLQSLAETWAFLVSRMSLTLLTGGLLVCYVAGIVIDAVGLSLGEWFLDARLARAPASTKVEAFWKNVNEHVLGYRDAQWAYFSCYRNLAILAVPAAVLWTPLVWRHLSPGWALGMWCIVAAMECMLVKSMKVLLELYYSITKAVAE